MAYRKLNDLENSEDLIMNTWAGSYPLRSFSESITNEKKAWIMTIRFEVARTAAISARSDLEPHFCSIEDFSSRCLKALRAKIPEIGISILSQHAKDL